MDGTEEHKDETQTTDTSSETKGTSEKEPETFTREQRDKSISDALSTAGRTDKDLQEKAQKVEQAVKDARNIMATAETTRTKWQREQDERDREANKDNSEALSAIDERIKHRDTRDKLTSIEAELESTKGKLTEADKKSATYTKEQNAREIAARLKVDYKSLMLTDGSKEAMENLAKALPKLDDKSTEELKLESGKTIGGGGNWEKVRAAYIKNPSNPAVRERYMEMRKKIDAQR